MDETDRSIINIEKKKKRNKIIGISATCAVLLCAFVGIGVANAASDDSDKKTTETNTTTTIVTTDTTEETTETTEETTEDYYYNYDDYDSYDYADEDYEDDKDDDGEYWCMGKNDTCKNKTDSPYDLYCDECDPDDNNIEGDQSKGDDYGIYDKYDEYYDDDYEDDDENDEDWNGYGKDYYDYNGDGYITGKEAEDAADDWLNENWY